MDYNNSYTSLTRIVFQIFFSKSKPNFCILNADYFKVQILIGCIIQKD